ncbi:MAG: ribosome biogenesis GTPase Der [Chitinivibrionales bacterium]|nr:ribosome biogenesis GTPase Der [Chitinivibrionales bacterium]MBD3395944.1 ribosome biogenesis GTPase Der [Chitinivibrionales bacterium]
MRSRLPIVSIVGRPNVGKSSLFNRILGRKAAVVDDVSGVTRDRHYAAAMCLGVEFSIVDTGGLVPSSRDGLVAAVRAQVDCAVAESAAIVLVCEAGTGPTDLDLLIARHLRRQCSGNVILAVNKAESRAARYEVDSFVSLGCGEPLAISALHGQGVGDLIERVVELVRAARGRARGTQPDADLSLAILGRPNAGKSLLVNTLLKAERMIVDAAPGTTRDAVDSFMTYHRTTIRLIDTAGLRRKSQVKEDLERYTNLRALQSIELADICILMIDAHAGIASQDLKILNKIREARRGVVVCFNKWDLVQKDHRTFDHLTHAVRGQYMELRHVPILSVSALTGLRVRAILDAALSVRERMRLRVNAKSLENNVLEWTRAQGHPLVGTKEVRFLGARQAKIDFPCFQLFCTNPGLVRPSYERYLMNKICEAYEFSGCPVVLAFKGPGRPKPGRPRAYSHAGEEEP